MIHTNMDLKRGISASGGTSSLLRMIVSPIYSAYSHRLDEQDNSDGNTPYSEGMF